MSGGMLRPSGGAGGLSDSSILNVTKDCKVEQEQREEVVGEEDEDVWSDPVVPLTVREKQSIKKGKLYKPVPFSFILEAQQQREHFITAVFKQLASKMSVFRTRESAEVPFASPRAAKLQLDSGLHQ